MATPSEPAPLASPPGRPRRLVYLGSPAAAVPPLRGLVAAGYEVVQVVTNPDRRRGRGGATSPTPVKAAAVELDLPVSHDPLDAVGCTADLGVVVAFGALIRRPVLEVLPMLNVHFSLLPRWRGAAPVERAILAGDTTTGVCVMGLEEGLDTGPVHARAETRIRTEETAAELTERLSGLGADLLVSTLDAGLGDPEPQRGEVTYAAKLDSSDRRLDFHRPATEVQRVVRVGGAWTTAAGSRLKVHRARVLDAGPPPGVLTGSTVGCDPGALELVVVQPEGKAAMDAGDWSRGRRGGGDLVLGS